MWRDNATNIYMTNDWILSDPESTSLYTGITSSYTQQLKQKAISDMKLISPHHFAVPGKQASQSDTAALRASRNHSAACVAQSQRCVRRAITALTWWNISRQQHVERKWSLWKRLRLGWCDYTMDCSEETVREERVRWTNETAWRIHHDEIMAQEIYRCLAAILLRRYNRYATHRRRATLKLTRSSTNRKPLNS